MNDGTTAQFGSVTRDQLSLGSDLILGDRLVANNGKSALSLGYDGRLMVWMDRDGNGVLESHQLFQSDVRMDRFRLTEDGQLLAYDGDRIVAGLNLEGPAQNVFMQGDGNFVAYGPDRVVFASNTAVIVEDSADLPSALAEYRFFTGDQPAGFALGPGDVLLSEDGSAAMVMEWTGHLVSVDFDAEGQVVSSKLVMSEDVTADQIVFQGDGNIVATDEAQVVWTSQTPGHVAATVSLSNEGQLTIVGTDGAVIFKTDAGAPCPETTGAGCQCAHKDETAAAEQKDIVYWSELRMPDGSVPGLDDIVVIDADKRVILDQDAQIKGLVIKGNFVVQDGQDLALTTDFALVLEDALFQVGTKNNPHQSDFTLTLTGDERGFDLDVSAYTDHCPDDHGGHMQGGVIQDNNAYLMAMGDNARIEMHAADQAKESWTQISQTANVGDTTLQLSEATGWQVGDRIGLATTDFDNQQSEEFTITAVSEDGLTVTLDRPVAYMHYGEVHTETNGKSGEAAQTWDIDLRAEVALLSRNVKIQGDEDSREDGYGGHTMVMHGGQMHLSGIEFDSMGQENIIGRYAAHWHETGDATGQYVSNSSFHNIHHNAVQIHGTQHALVENNAFWDTKGAGVFFEDGAEWGNRIIDNLSVKMDAVPALEDATSSNFWIENPDNSFVGNHAVGAGTGFFFSHEFGIDGSSAASGLYDDLRPYQQAGPTEFVGNAAHSTGWGLYIKNMRSDGIENPAYTVTDFTGYKNIKAIFARTEGGLFENAMLSDNQEGTYFRLNQTIADSVIIGRSDNIGTLVTDEEIAQGRSLPPKALFFGINNYDGPFTAQNVHFDGFMFGDGTEMTHDAAIGAFAGVDKTFNNVVTGLSFGAHVDEENKVWMTTGQLDGAYAANGLYDMDGSLTGIAGALVTSQIVNEGGSAITAGTGDVIVRDDWVSFISTDAYFARFELVNLDPDGGELDFTMSRSDGQVYNRSYGQDQFMMLLGDEVHHDVSMLNADVGQYRFEFTQMRMGDAISFTLRDLPTLSTVQLFDPVSGQAIDILEVKTREDLLSVDTSAIWRGEDGITLRIVAEQTGSYHYLQPGITVYGEGVILGGAFVVVDRETLVDPDQRVLTSFLQGTNGDDVLVGEGANDQINAGAGDDQIFGGDGDDVIDGYSGDDTIEGGAGNDSIQAEFGNDVVYGGAGHDLINGFAGDDDLFGGAGNDSLIGENGRDTIDGGDGDDVIDGGARADSINAGIGDDHVFGGDGDDVIDGFSGADTIDGGAGDDQIFGGDGDDVIDGYSGDDTIQGGAGNDSIQAEFGNDVVYGGGGDDLINGFAGDDDLFGGVGADTMIGENGQDTLTDGAGQDLLIGGADADTFVFVSDGVTDTIQDFQDAVDRIDLSAFGVTFRDLTIDQDGSSARVSVDGEEIVVENTDARTLFVDDFIF